ncbi:unnamed protein product [Trichobilharzia szidati]|nr:unnamed protein product [Trichobilharzia szidati]
MKEGFHSSYDIHVVSFLHKIKCTVYLNESGIHVIRNHHYPSSTIHIHKAWLIGCKKGVRSRWTENGNACLKLNFFSIKKNYVKNTNVKVLTKASINMLFLSEQEADKFIRTTELLFQNTQLSDMKPYLVLINPKSGTKKAVSIFNTKVAPIWKQMNIPYKLMCTEYPGHAQDFILKLSEEEISSYRAVVPCSGDGLINEVVRAIALRQDYNVGEEYRVPIGIIPAVFLLSLPPETMSLPEYEMGMVSDEGKLRLTLPTFQCISPLTGIRFGTDNKNSCHFGVLSIEWGIFSDLDYKSEKLRWMGETRFAVYGYYCILKKQSYRAKLSYLPIDNQKSQNLKNNGSKTTEEDSISQSSLVNKNVKDLRRRPNESTDSIKISSKSWYYLPDIDKPISNDNGKWVVLDDEFISILVLNHSHMAASAVVQPDAHFSDPYLSLVIIHKNTTRLDLIRIAQAISSGKGLKSTPYMDIVQISAVRVDPYPNSSVITMLDGELMPSGACQAEEDKPFEFKSSLDLRSTYKLLI